MKRFALGLVAGIWFAGAAFGLNDRAAVGLGVMTVQTNPNTPVSNALRLSAFLDLGTRLNRQFSGGFELQGDVAQFDERTFALEDRDITEYHLGQGSWVGHVSQTSYSQTYTLVEADLSPRFYLAFEWDKEAQIQGFAGLNLNWQNLDYSLKNTSASTLFDPQGKALNPGETRTSKVYLGQNVQFVLGARMTASIFYFDYSQYVNLDSDKFSLSDTDVNRFGLGLAFRF